ncbi:Zn-ribbon domain-containing OB-fold protein [Halorubrum sp. SD626R]|uniref:Zn-ribbon domain-containing OB-fold protein n=1 Tax=Halorubrum sp. SD626R TaxID=1419722 RepID=UPI000A51B284|nr:OB-fold domain-containing protein [Halorubrum sp. SD626R]TKX82192.1 nucleic acid-binding protein [Halorubrum sp. SD626R]
MSDGGDSGDGAGSGDAGDVDLAERAPTPVTDADHDEWLDALAAGEGYALVCPDGHGSLPPRRICPECGSASLSREPLGDTGRVETFSVVHVPSPRFADDAPYVTAVVDLGPVRTTGVLRGVEPAGDAIEVGLSVAVGVEERATDGEPLVVFRPANDG